MRLKSVWLCVLVAGGELRDYSPAPTIVARFDSSDGTF